MDEQTFMVKVNQLIDAAKSNMFYRILVAIKDIQQSGYYAPDELCALLEERFKKNEI